MGLPAPALCLLRLLRTCHVGGPSVVSGFSYIIGHEYYYYRALRVVEPTTSQYRRSIPLLLSPKTLCFPTIPDKRPKEVNTWSMWPNLHQGVVDLLKDNKLEFAFHLADDKLDLVKSYDTNVMGRFICYNTKCSSSGWSSKQIAITIRLYQNNEYNARVWHQRCKSCNQLSKPMLDQTYAERVAYRLKKWSGVPLEPPEYSRKDVNGPHNKDLCEGCKNNHCSYSAETKWFEDSDTERSTGWTNSTKIVLLLSCIAVWNIW